MDKQLHGKSLFITTNSIMKHIFLALLLLPTLGFAQSISWDAPLEVNTDKAFGHTRPKIVIPEDGKPVVMWGKANNLGVFVSKWTGTAFTNPVKVTPDGMNAFVLTWAGPSLAVNNNDVFVAFKSQPENSGFVYVVKSNDGGLTFGDTVRVSDNNWSRFPEVAVLPNGNPVVTYMDFDPDFKDPRYVVSVSNDGGKTFQKIVNASEDAPGEACDCCPGFIMADENRITVLFRNNDNDLRDIWASISEDGGKTFQLAEDIDKNNWMIGGCPSTGAEAITLGDSLVAVWMSGASGNSMVNIGTSALSDLSVGMNAEITPDVMNGNQNYPKIVGDKDLLAVVWQEVANSSRNVNLALSTKGPSGFSSYTPEQVNINSKGVQQSPDIEYDGEYIHVVWQDLTAQKLMYRKGKVDKTSSIQTHKKHVVTAYPNPAHHSLVIEVNGEQLLGDDVSIINTLGQVMSTVCTQNNGTIELDVSGLTPGLYFVRVKLLGNELVEPIHVRND